MTIRESPRPPGLLSGKKVSLSLHMLTRRASEGSEALPLAGTSGSYELLRCQGNILDCHVPCLRERCYNTVVCDDQGHPMTRDTIEGPEKT